ncbi:hypothetical protein [Spirosoma luteum]|uniref:hypothetical protein n=1 Tax=Spirosoma luteum TaxID=431553 RepID=UPI00037AB8BF|nr:hypothetical protein [Spirosoma luteum]
MKSFIAVGCLLAASTCFAQQSSRAVGVDSLKNLDNMPVIRDGGNPVPIPIRKGAGMAVDMPTRRMETHETPEVLSGKGVELLGKQFKELKIDSLTRINPRKKKL